MAGPPPWSEDGVGRVPRRPRSEYSKRKAGDAWMHAAKRVKLDEDSESDEEAQALEALLGLQAGAGDFGTDQGPVPRVKSEEPPSRVPRSAAHHSSAKPTQKRKLLKADDRDWAPSKEPASVRSSISAPKAVKASTSSAQVTAPGILIPPASNIGLGMGLGAFAGPFPGGINGANYTHPGPMPASQATSAAQGAIWPPAAPFLGGLRSEDVPEAAGSGQDVLMPPQRRNWKRCASHVYIAHFIEYQLHREKIQKQQQAQLLAARLGSIDAPLADSMANGMTNGDHIATSAATISERLGSGGSGGTPPKRVTPLQTLVASQSLSLGNGLAQAMASNPQTLPFPQASMALGSMPSMGNGQLGQPNSFSQTYAQQLQNQLLMQQGGSFPFLGPGMAAFGGPRNGGLSAQQLAGFAFPASAHMLGLASYAALGQQLGGGTGNGFTPPKSEMPDGMSTDIGALRRAALSAGLKPEDAMKLGLSGLSNPEAANRLHTLGVPPGLLSSARAPGGPMGGPSFHEQLLAATSAQRPESQGVPLMR